MSWNEAINLILLESIDATDPHNSNYAEKSKNWKEVIKALKEIFYCPGLGKKLFNSSFCYFLDLLRIWGEEQELERGY